MDYHKTTIKGRNAMGLPYVSIGHYLGQTCGYGRDWGTTMKGSINSKARERRERIARHGLQLLDIFTDAKERDPIELCKKLHRLEAEAHKIAEYHCNFGYSEEAWERATKRVLDKVQSLLGGEGPEVFLNGDARGYALKIDDEAMKANKYDLQRDWGGYGIICPEIE